MRWQKGHSCVPRHVCNNAFVREVSGQATVEAAFMLPILFACVLLLAQPAILLYDRCVMQAAAAEGCRILSTAPAGQANEVELYVRRRLAAVPQQESFHVHDGSCSWEIELAGSESSDQVSVTIRNRVKPLPLLDFACKAFRISDGDGTLPIEITARLQTKSAWVSGSSAGANPSAWVGTWLS